MGFFNWNVKTPLNTLNLYQCGAQFCYNVDSNSSFEHNIIEHILTHWSQKIVWYIIAISPKITIKSYNTLKINGQKSRNYFIESSVIF